MSHFPVKGYFYSLLFLDSIALITQEILVDGATVLFLSYELDRQTGGPMPSAALRGYQKYRGASSSPPFPTSSPANTTSSTHASSASPLPYSLHSSSNASSASSSPFGGAHTKIGSSSVFPHGTHSNNSSISSLGSLGGSLTSASSSATIHGGAYNQPQPASPYGQQSHYVSPQSMSMRRPF